MVTAQGNEVFVILKDLGILRLVGPATTPSSSESAVTRKPGATVSQRSVCEELTFRRPSPKTRDISESPGRTVTKCSILFPVRAR